MKTNTLNSSEKKSEFKKDNSVTIIRNVVRIFLIVWAILIILPLGWTILTSLKSADEVSFESAWSLPATLRWNNYAVAWTKANFSLFFMNSVILSVGTVILTLLMTTATAYVVSKFVHPVIKGIKWFFSLFMMVPQLLLLVPLYYMCDDLNLLSGGTVLVTLMITNALQGVPYYVFLLTPFMCGINNAILEAAEIDGAGKWREIFSITLPSILPTIVIMLIMQIGAIMGSNFEKIYLMQNNGNLEKSEVIATYVYKTAFKDYNYGLSTAVGLFNSVVALVLVTIANIFSKKFTETSLW